MTSRRQAIMFMNYANTLYSQRLNSPEYVIYIFYLIDSGDVNKEALVCAHNEATRVVHIAS